MAISRKQQAAITCTAIGSLLSYPQHEIKAWLQSHDEDMPVKMVAAGGEGEQLVKRLLLNRRFMHIEDISHAIRAAVLSAITGIITGILMGLNDDNNNVEIWSNKLTQAVLAASRTDFLVPITIDFFEQLVDSNIIGLRTYVYDHTALQVLRHTADLFTRYNCTLSDLRDQIPILHRLAANADRAQLLALTAAADLVEAAATLKEIREGKISRIKEMAAEQILSVGKLVRQALEEITAAAACAYVVANRSQINWADPNSVVVVQEQRALMYGDMAAEFCKTADYLRMTWADSPVGIGW